MNEVAEAFWNQDNDFWLVAREHAVQLAFHERRCDCCTHNLDLKIENCMTVAMSNDDVAEYLTRHSGEGVVLWNLETNQYTMMRRKVSE